MKFADYKLIFAAVGLIGILIFASPALGMLIRFPGGEQFSELYILGPNQMAQDIPFNIAANQSYLVYLGVGNHLGNAAYYTCYIKLRNQTEPSPDDTTQTPSTLPQLLEYQTFIQNSANWTAPLTFSLNDVLVTNNQSLLRSITINGLQFKLDKSAQFDQVNNGYYYQILVELWALNSTSGTLQYQNRYVYFWLNVTSTV